jgi:hypothetical protein
MENGGTNLGRGKEEEGEGIVGEQSKMYANK